PVGVDPEERLLPPTRAAEHQLERRVGDLERLAPRLAVLRLREQRTHVALGELEPELGGLHPERRGTAEIARDDAAVVADGLGLDVLVRPREARDPARVEAGL